MKALSATALNAAFGEIASIAVATDLKNPKAYVRRNDSIDDELRLINEFFDDFRKIPAGFTLVGHNVYGFDRKFIHQRAMIHGLKAPQIFTRELKPWELSGVIGDTMMMWNNYQLGNNISLDDLCTAFGLRGKGSVCGSDVGELFRSGMYKEIADYNIDDVIITRDLYLKMIEVMR
jgi:predicted PolB exonuclease-like 3'-5' exonuclease